MRAGTRDEPAESTARVLRRFDNLPGPRGIPWFGNALQVDTSRLHL